MLTQKDKQMKMYTIKSLSIIITTMTNTIKIISNNKIKLIINNKPMILNKVDTTSGRKKWFVYNGYIYA